jgi:hypothetical protein
MGHQQVCRVAVGGKHPASKFSRTLELFAQARRPAFAAIAFFVAVCASSPSHAQAGGPYAGMAGRWSGGGNVTLDDGSSERIRCRATYAVSGPNMEMSLTCASDSYKFNLAANVVDQGGAVSGTWSESSRGVTGTLQGRGGGGNFQVLASAAGFNANIALRTTGNKQSVTMRADSQFRGANISLSK